MIGFNATVTISKYLEPNLPTAIPSTVEDSKSYYEEEGATVYEALAKDLANSESLLTSDSENNYGSLSGYEEEALITIANELIELATNNPDVFKAMIYNSVKDIELVAIPYLEEEEIDLRRRTEREAEEGAGKQ